MLHLSNVSKVYGEADNGDATNVVRALDCASFEIHKGEFVLIVGSSGSGKTTLLNIIGLLNTPTSGRIMIDGVDVTRLSNTEAAHFRNRKIGFVAQFANLLMDLTILENVMLPRQIAGGALASDGDRLKRDAMNLLQAVGLEGQAERRANKVSGGQAQRAAIARGLINRPSIILADEPTGNLDSVSSRSVIDLMKSTAKRLHQTFVIVTHDRDFFGDVDRVITVTDGRVTEADGRWNGGHNYDNADNKQYNNDNDNNDNNDNNNNNNDAHTSGMTQITVQEK